MQTKKTAINAKKQKEQKMRIIVKQATVQEIKERDIKDKETQKVTGQIRTATVKVWGATFDVTCDSNFHIDEMKELGKLGTVIFETDVRQNLKMQFGKLTYDAPVAICPTYIIGYQADKEQSLIFE